MKLTTRLRCAFICLTGREFHLARYFGKPTVQPFQIGDVTIGKLVVGRGVEILRADHASADIRRFDLAQLHTIVCLELRNPDTAVDADIEKLLRDHEPPKP